VNAEAAEGAETAPFTGHRLWLRPRSGARMPPGRRPAILNADASIAFIATALPRGRRSAFRGPSTVTELPQAPVPASLKPPAFVDTTR